MADTSISCIICLDGLEKSHPEVKVGEKGLMPLLNVSKTRQEKKLVKYFKTKWNSRTVCFHKEKNVEKNALLIHHVKALHTIITAKWKHKSSKLMF